MRPDIMYSFLCLSKYATDQAVQIADTVVAYQTAIGGWTKNTGFHKKRKKSIGIVIKPDAGNVKEK